MSNDNENYEENHKLKLNEIWRTCNKIRAAIFRTGLNLCSYFKEFDLNNNTLLSESQFINVLKHQLKDHIGLADEEITELADYFRVHDGRIAYIQFCDVIHDNDDSDNVAERSDLVTGLEWEDPLHQNRLSQSEHRRLFVLLTKISHSLRLRDIVLRPYFQDYELISKNTGTVTLAHFNRILTFLGLTLSTNDYQLLVKRFIKDSYTVNYVAFVEQIDKIMRYFDSKKMVDYSGDIIENFPGKLINVDLPKLPRPEIDHINVAEVFGKESSFHAVLKPKKPTKSMNEILLRIKHYVHENRIRVNEFFQHYDPLNSGYITKSQFLRGLDLLGLSGLGRCYLSDIELDCICTVYADTYDPSRINWKLFEIDIEKVFTTRWLEKNPFEIVESEPNEIYRLQREGQVDWQEQTEKIRDLCEEALFKAKSIISKRQLYLDPIFRDFDRLNLGHVSRSQMRRVLLTNGILLSDEELYALEKRYNNDIGFNYRNFLAEADPREYIIPYTQEFNAKSKLINCEKVAKTPTVDELDIVKILAKIKGQVVRKQIKINEFMQDFDRHRKECITLSEFQRGFSMADVKLSVPEINVVCDVFKSPLLPNNVDYKRFCTVINESFYQCCLDKAPLLVPLQHIPTNDNSANFLNFDERNSVSKALMKLSKHGDQISNLSELFTDYDKVNCGTISRNDFLRALTTRNLNGVISTDEFDVVCKCFGFERGLRLEVNYREFLRVLDVLMTTTKNYPF